MSTIQEKVTFGLLSFLYFWSAQIFPGGKQRATGHFLCSGSDLEATQLATGTTRPSTLRQLLSRRESRVTRQRAPGCSVARVC